MIENEAATAIESKPNRIVGVWRNPLVQAFLNDPITLISATILAIICLLYTSPSPRD